ncbi:hypothetical protein LIER_36902 [Lithospermum erythrorhizon]|uniref:Uncharacterized protein n=1 Tax=Lithospermum erythrorhizon TaxID=34254 RepID=A0AAV3PCC1_LITER
MHPRMASLNKNDDSRSLHRILSAKSGEFLSIKISHRPICTINACMSDGVPRFISFRSRSTGKVVKIDLRIILAQSYPNIKINDFGYDERVEVMGKLLPELSDALALTFCLTTKVIKMLDSRSNLFYYKMEIADMMTLSRFNIIRASMSTQLNGVTGSGKLIANEFWVSGTSPQQLDQAFKSFHLREGQLG